MKPPAGTVHIFAVGNPLYGDDGAGKAVLDELKIRQEFSGATFFDAYTDALSLIHRFQPGGLNIIIDAAKMGRPPGSVVLIRPENARTIIKWDHLSLHGFGLAETIQMAKQVGSCPADLLIIGIEPEVIRVDRPISDVVKRAIPKAVELIKTEVKKYEQRITDHSHHRR